MRHCRICNKGSIVRNKRKLLRGHYNPTGKKRKYPNLQKTKVDGVTTLACTQCMRTMAKNGL